MLENKKGFKMWINKNLKLHLEVEIVFIYFWGNIWPNNCIF